MLTKTVALVGMMGAGKTAVGGALARKLGVPFLDTDEEIERAANMTIAEIFERDGEAFFRDKESQVLQRLLSSEPAILSTGGGAFLAERNRQAMRELGVSVWLKVDLDVLWSRVQQKTTRPLLQTPNPHETLARIYRERRDIYALAEVVVEGRKGASVDETAETVLDALRARSDVLREPASD